ncbi:SRPBCC family protein [Nocardioides ungokensis]|uniref:SRPBCC family protein n=1 Tax=Nocardioides ungokensis TaxID=1643322 RepID=UPI0015DF70D6|nr:SRPBCC family protein [Nocardioides ungokensis]
MSRNVRVIKTTPDRVWAVLADGWLYPLWVVGATRMREVDDGWPSVGSRIHHSVGVWPMVLDDDTEVLECEPERRLKLRARGWPPGEADVELRLTAVSGGTEVEMVEDITAGPARLVPKPVRAPLITWRNTESLRRLAFLAERRAAPAEA